MHAEGTDDDVGDKADEAIVLDGFSAEEVEAMRASAEHNNFEAEVNRMMKLIINSLYKNKVRLSFIFNIHKIEKKFIHWNLLHESISFKLKSCEWNQNLLASSGMGHCYMAIVSLLVNSLVDLPRLTFRG